MFFLEVVKASKAVSKPKLRASSSGRCRCSVLHTEHNQGILVIPVKHSWQKVCPQEVIRKGDLEKSRQSGHLNCSSILEEFTNFSLSSDPDSLNWVAYQKEQIMILTYASKSDFMVYKIVWTNNRSPFVMTSFWQFCQRGNFLLFPTPGSSRLNDLEFWIRTPKDN